MNGVTSSSIAMPYSGKMVQFYAIPAKTDSGTGRVRLKVEKPVGSTGVMIRYKTSAWVDTDTKDTGTLVANITDDTSYKGVNQWYEATGLTSGTVYYFKAFPYKEGVYNTIIGVNETACTAGTLSCELTADSISGSTVNDTSGNSYNGTIAGNITAAAGVVGNEFVKSNAAYTNTISIPTTFCRSNAQDQSYCCWINVPTVVNDANAFVPKYQGARLVLAAASGKFAIEYNGVTVDDLLGETINANTDYFVIVKFKASTNTITLKSRASNGGSWNTYTKVATPHNNAQNSLNILYTVVQTMDQWRYFSHVLTDAEDDNLYNGGAGC